METQDLPTSVRHDGHDPLGALPADTQPRDVRIDGNAVESCRGRVFPRAQVRQTSFASIAAGFRRRRNQWRYLSRKMKKLLRRLGLVNYLSVAFVATS